jgi:hypothetical protein
MNVNLAYYRKKDWRKLLEMIDDRDSMHDTWKEWHKSYLKVKRDLISQGFAVNDFVVDLNELKKYCADMGMKIDGNARSRFVSNK